MRIGIDARLYNESGIGRYIRNLLKNLQSLDSSNEYYIFLLKKDFEELKLTKNFYKVEANFQWYGIEEQLKFPGLIKKYNLDLIHFPHFNVPIFYPGRFIVTIHDLIHQHATSQSSSRNPYVYALKKLAYHRVFSHAVKNSRKIVTVSNFVKQQLIDEWKVPSEKIIVSYEAVEDEIIKYASEINREEIRKVLNKYQIQPPFIFYVGNVHPHKNVESLIEAFLHLRKNYQYLQLVLSGRENFFWKRLKDRYSQKGIIYTGYITDQEMVCLYKSAAVFAMPSKEEGFGIPVLEAYACACPTAISNQASLPEIAHGASLLFNPESVADISDKIGQVLNEQKIKQALVIKGEARYKQFSWHTLAEQTLALYKASV